MIKILKLIKILALSLVVSSGMLMSFSLVSCGHEKVNPPTYSWADFKKAANAEKAISIVEVTKPDMWSNAKADQLHIENFKANDKTKIITLDITRNLSGYGITKGKFSINNKNDYKYDVQDWECETQPKIITTGWELYKAAAIKVTADDLLKEAEPWDDLDTFKWTYGTTQETTWIQSETAQWDVYGALPGGGDAYKGMAGKPTVTESPKKIITAIISKKGKDGAFDSDPIKATISTYKIGAVYNINDWTFDKDTQLQSFNKFVSLFNTQVKQASSWAEFNDHNWMTIDGNNAANSHPGSPTIEDILKAKYSPNKLTYFQLQTPSNPPELNGETGYQAKIVFTFNYWVRNTDPPIQYKLSLYFNYNFANKKDKKSGGGTAFNYIWEGVIWTPPNI